MLYTRLAVCSDKSEVVVTRLAVHAMISHNCLCRQMVKCGDAGLQFKVSRVRV